ncbi:MAG: glycosyltransferase family 2 protein [Alphaproteobacteria bacterium]|nr:glycosyltransferase family 2 protein [Alphaproteobacteria bacterium]
MITLVIPTRNRAFTLEKVAPSFFSQPLVSEIILVIDAGTDRTEELVRSIASGYPSVALKIVRNPSRSGAAHCRNVGAQAASNEFVLYCDDDQYLSPGYAATCYSKLNAGADIVCGRMVNLLGNETMEEGIARFGEGITDSPPFDPRTLDAVMGARVTGDVVVPVANNAILTRKSLILRMPFDSYYSARTGWREESDCQMNAFVHGYKLLMTNDAHTVHLSFADTATGGARTNAVYALYCVIRNTRYFYRKYHRGYVAATGSDWSPRRALVIFAARQTHARLVRPLVVRLRSRAIRQFRRLPFVRPRPLLNRSHSMGNSPEQHEGAR